MSQNFIYNATFHLLLNKIDQEFVKNRRQQECGCGGTLHQANYPRSPIGLPPSFRDHYSERFSLCCDTCRKRITPPSVRSFGRRWFPAPLFVLISVLTLGINNRRLEQVKQHFGITVSESTWKRWRRWWQESFMATSFWAGQRFGARHCVNTLFTACIVNGVQGGTGRKNASSIAISITTDGRRFTRCLREENFPQSMPLSSKKQIT